MDRLRVGGRVRVPGREQALAEASDLERVCRPREVSTAEVFEPNAFYGNDLVLKMHAGLPEDRPLKVVVPHGIVFNDSYLWQAERRALLPAVLVYGAYRERAYRKAAAALAIRSAVPFAYLPGLLDGHAQVDRSGTLFFPAHSSHRVTAESDYAGMAEAIVRFDARFHPVTVCLYWRDHELGRHRPFLDRGLRVVSAGHMYDPAFLFRLYHLCRSHRYACGSYVGSNLLYSVLAGCRYFLLPGFGLKHSGDERAQEQDLSRGGAYLSALAGAFAEPVEALTSRQSALVAEVCGLDALLGAGELRGLLVMADRLDRRGVARHPRTGRMHLALPRTWLRAARRMLQCALRGLRASAHLRRTAGR